MTTLEVTFPEPWATLSRNRRLEEARGIGIDGSTHAYVTALHPALAEVDVDGFASLTVPDRESDTLVTAFCAIGDVPRRTDEEAELRTIAEGGLHPGLERDTTTVQLPVGPAIRSSAFRFAEELLDDTALAPYAFEVRFAFAVPGHRAGVLHFETTSLTYLEDLEGLFDAIADTATLA